MTSKTLGHLFYTTSSIVHHFKAIRVFNWRYSPEMLNSGQNCWFLVLCDLEIWQMAFKINRTPLLYYDKLCASFQSYQWIQTGVAVRKHWIWFAVDNFFGHLTSKFDRWPWKTTGYLFFTTSSIVHHFKATSEFKLELTNVHEIDLLTSYAKRRKVTSSDKVHKRDERATNEKDIVIGLECTKLVRMWNRLGDVCVDNRTKNRADRRVWEPNK